MELISNREFARRLNVDEKAVRKAIASGKIVNGLHRRTSGRTCLDYHIALREWQANQTDVSLTQTKGGTPIDFDSAKKKNFSAKVHDGDEEPDEAKLTQQATSTQKINYNRAAVKLQHETLALKQKMGLLIEKDKVNKELFEAGKEIRESLLIIPDRIVDELRAVETRDEAHQLLYKEIEHALERLSRFSFDQPKEDAA